MNEYEVEIRLDGKHTAYVKVRKNQTAICQRATVTCLFGSVEEKAKKKAAKIVKEWDNFDNGDRIVYGIKGQ